MKLHKSLTSQKAQLNKKTWKPHSFCKKKNPLKKTVTMETKRVELDSKVTKFDDEA